MQGTRSNNRTAMSVALAICIAAALLFLRLGPGSDLHGDSAGANEESEAVRDLEESNPVNAKATAVVHGPLGRSMPSADPGGLRHDSLQADVAAVLAKFPDLLRNAIMGDLSAVEEIRGVIRRCRGSPKSAEELAMVLGLVGADDPSLPIVKDQLGGLARACIPLYDAVSIQERVILLEQHADAGDSDARLEYINQMDEIIGSSTSVRDDLQVYRTRAQRYLREGVANGDPDALTLFGLAYDRGTAFRADPVLAAAYMGARVDVTTMNSGPLQSRYDQLLRLMSDADRERVLALRHEIAASFKCKSCN